MLEIGALTSLSRCDSWRWLMSGAVDGLLSSFSAIVKLDMLVAVGGMEMSVSWFAVLMKSE